MNYILARTKDGASQMYGVLENIKQQAQAQPDFDVETVKKTYVLPHFETLVKKVQEEACDKFDVDSDEIEEAVTTYIENGDVKLIEISTKLKRMYRDFGGETDDISAGGTEEKKEELSFNEIVTFISVYTDKLLEKIKEATIEYKNEFGIPDTEETNAHFQQYLGVESGR